MITSKDPQSWEELQEWTAQILKECGFIVEIEKTIKTARGKVEIDVYAEETVKGRTYRILCECKNWKAKVPKNVIHGFRTVVADSGSNVGYIISSVGFQSGAMTAAELTNLKLLTWQKFQAEFEESWFEHFLLPFVAERFDALLTYAEPFLPPAFGKLDGAGQKNYLALKERYDAFGWVMFSFTPYTRVLQQTPYTNPLPLRKRLPAKHHAFYPQPVLDATGYREFLEAAVAYGDKAIAEFDAALEPGHVKS